MDHGLARILASALRGHRGDRPFDELEQGLLHAFARDVARDRRVFALAGDLVDFVEIDDPALGLLDVAVGRLHELGDDVFDVFAHVARFGKRRRVSDRERHVKRLGEGLREQGLARTRRTDKQNVGLLQFDVGELLVARAKTLVVVVDRHGKRALGELLTDHVLIEVLVEFPRRRQRLGRGGRFLGFFLLSGRILGEFLRQETHALVTNRLAVQTPEKGLALGSGSTAERTGFFHVSPFSRPPFRAGGKRSPSSTFRTLRQ